MRLSRYSYYYRKGKIKTTERFIDVVPSLISLWLEKVRQHPYFDEFDCYLFGSSTYLDKTGDMDIFFTGEYLPEILVGVMDYALQCAFELKIKADILYIPDYSYLERPPYHSSNKVYSVYTTYDHEMMVEDGKVVLFRDYGSVMKDGLFRSTHSQYHKKSVDREQKLPRIKKLN